jgi:hypothetical protein
MIEKFGKIRHEIVTLHPERVEMHSKPGKPDDEDFMEIQIYKTVGKDGKIFT